ncbi:hypothetical protein V1503_18805 [Bacillus sp. SCS-151]|uniref:hypothetical protein n=1 Tax=Nanhaiella sioensis TaxID=3115293 RepID=UPI00397D9865
MSLKVKPDFSPFFNRFERSKELAYYAKENQWSESEFKDALQLLHSIFNKSDD